MGVQCSKNRLSERVLSCAAAATHARDIQGIESRTAFTLSEHVTLPGTCSLFATGPDIVRLPAIYNGSLRRSY
jgi:hypothetical protein